jgi:hypothetical protein
MSRMILELDEADYATIQQEIARRQVRGDTETLPDFDPDHQNIAGAMIAETIRDLDDYRDLYGELEALRAVSARMRPVVEAACKVITTQAPPEDLRMNSPMSHAILDLADAAERGGFIDDTSQDDHSET